MDLGHSDSSRQRSAFTLIEVVIVIGLISLVAGVAIANMDNLLGAFERTPPEVQFRHAVREARILAADEGRPAYVRFDSLEEAFKVIHSVTEPDEDADQSPLAATTDYGFSQPDVEVVFYPTPAEVYGGINRFDGIDSLEPLTQLAFHPSGASTPATIIIRERGRDELRLTLDSFSSGPQASKELFE
ncbi:MAG: type II secretion system protein [Verrucomicrobiota bacterium]